MQIQTKIFGRLFVLENIRQQTLVARAENNGVVGDIGILLFRTEVPDKQAIGIMRFINFAISPLLFGCL